MIGKKFTQFLKSIQSSFQARKCENILKSKLSLNVQNIYIKTFVFYVILLTLNVAEYRTNENHSAKYYLR